MVHIKDTEQGTIILIFLIMLPFLIAITGYFTELALTSFQVSQTDNDHTVAQLAADAGADYGVEQIAANNNWVGTGGEETLHSDSRYKTTYSDTVSNSGSDKVITITGRTYRPASAAKADSSVAVAVTLYPVSNNGYSVVSGAGGLYMSNHATIVGGSVFINGEISMSNNSQIGLAILPVSVQDADDRCPIPADSTYPQVCNASQGNPITLTNSSHIYGAVTATNQTTGSGMSSPGLQSGSVAPLALPTYNRSAQISAVKSTATGASESCSLGVKNWPANLEIIGNVNISGLCAVTVDGDVWITGNLTVSNTGSLIVSTGLGNTVPHIMVDGSSGASFSNAASLLPNLNLTGFEILTYWSAASCSPNCSSVTGTDLYNSRSTQTITLSNSATAVDTTFYAYWSEVSLSNAGGVGSVIGQTISLNNSTAITFGGSSGAGSTVYVIKGYRRL